MLSTASEGEPVVAPEPEDEREACWRAKLAGIKDGFKSRLDESVFDGVRDERIYHGLKLTAASVLQRPFLEMCFCDESQEYLVLDKGVEMHRYSMQGKYLHPPHVLPDPTFLFTRMLWCGGSGCLVCYDPDGQIVWLLTSRCKSVKTMTNDFRTKKIYYEPTANTIIVVGPHQSTKYPLDDLEQDLETMKAMTYIDPEFGATWELDYTSLIPPSASAPWRLASSYLTTLYLLPLEVDPDKESEGSIEYLARRTNASKASITAVMYHPLSSWIVIGDQQGNVAAWSLGFELMMSVGGVHEGRLRKLYPHPSICGFLSYSQEAGGSIRLQVWSCNFRGPVELLPDELGEVNACAVVESAATVVVLAAKLYYFTMHQMYCFFAPLTEVAKSLFSSANPMCQTKIIAASEDNSVRIFSAHGKQLNVQILPKETLNVVSATYSGTKNLLYTIILKSGEILMSDTSVCPIKFKHVFINDGRRITCLTVYEYFDEVRDHNGRPRNPRVFYIISNRIILGTEEGSLIVIDENTGKPDIAFIAHQGSIIQLRSSIAQQRLISLGADRCVKVWRILADLEDPVALCYTLYFIIPITRVALMGCVLCMANCSENSKVHKVIMENMEERVRLEHPNSKDHTATIIDMITSESLEICATSSMDKTIRVWDHENNLLKILEVNTWAWHTTFSSIRGDIIFSSGRHLYKISHENYLAPKYRAKIAANDLPEEVDEEKVAEDSDYRVFEGRVDRDLMLNPVISATQAAIDITNPDMPRVDLLILRQICALYEYRDKDIREIKENLVKTTLTLGDRALMTTGEWEKYVHDLLASMTRMAADVPEYKYHDIRENCLKEEKDYNESGVFKMLFGYSVDDVDAAENVEELVKGSNLPLHTFLPNSLLYKHKEEKPPVAVVEEPIVKKHVKYRYPPEFTNEGEKSDEVSLRLSQLLDMDNMNNVEAETQK